jgi:hypothetical protein
MFGTVIKTDKSGDLIIDPKYFSLCPQLAEVYNDKNLGGSVLKYIVNVYDRKSIYRHLPLDVRKEDVCIAVFGKKTHPRLTHEKVIAAIDLYEYVQYDTLVDQYNSMVNKSKEKMMVYNQIKVTEENMAKMNKMESDMQKSTEGLEKLRERIQDQEEEREILGNGVGNLSYIEERLIKYQQQQKK